MRGALPVLIGVLAGGLAFAVVMVVSDDDPPTAPEQRTAAPVPPEQRSGLAVYARMGCGGCHRLAAARSTGEIGPSLDAALPSYNARSLRAKIVSPTPGTAMPPDFGERLTDEELDALVGFLLATRH